MALQSQLLSSDPKLEAAALSDAGHIVPGAIGPHVAKIQQALVQLDGATIAQDGSYGPKTAAAVLAYKQERNIINYSYQTNPDNIVGRMTIAALDKEMLELELRPVWLQPILPLSRMAIARSKSGLLLAFNIPGKSLFTDLRPVPVRPFSTPGPDLLQEEVIIARGGIGTFKVLDGRGGNLVRSQEMSFYGRAKNGVQVAGLRGAKTPDRAREELDISDDDTTVIYDALNCGETFFQARVSPPQPPQKLSNIMRLLSLVDKAESVLPPPGDYSPEPGLKSGLVSKQGTPLSPLPGRKINIFGEGESSGFEDYSSDIDFCTHGWSTGNGPSGAGLGHRPWTADPRKPPGIPNKSIQNICCRSSPILPVTINEILRIGASGCRVTYAEGRGKANCDLLRAGLRGAKVIDEGVWGIAPKGGAIVFELA
jgi:hypothetical protein